MAVEANGGDVEDLRREVAELREQLGTKRRRRRLGRRLRSAGVAVLIVVASVLAPLAAMTVFLRSVVLNTDQYLSIVAPLSKDQAIASSMSTAVTTQLFSQVDVHSEIKDALPKRAQFLADPLTAAMKSATQALAYKVIVSDGFNRAWTNANRRLHNNLVGVLTGSGGSALTADNSGTVRLDLHTLAVQVVNGLKAKGITIFDRVPVNKVGGHVTLFQAPGLVKAQNLTSKLNSLAWLVPALSIACFAAAVAVAWRRRRALLWCGVGLAGSMAVLTIVIGLARSYLLDAAAGHTLTPAAAAVLFDAFLNTPITWLRISFVVGVLVVLVAWLVGPSRPARAVRGTLASAGRFVARALSGHDRTVRAAGRWIAAHEGPVQSVLAVIGFIILVWWGNPGIGGALIVLLVFGAAMTSVHVLARRSRPPPGGNVEVSSEHQMVGAPALGDADGDGGMKTPGDEEDPQPVKGAP